jgi:hypothetical protein
LPETLSGRAPWAFVVRRVFQRDFEATVKDGADIRNDLEGITRETEL